MRRRPPLWLAAAGIASLWAGAHAIAVWIFLFLSMPIHEDVRMIYVASQAGLRYGWSTIYDQATLRMLSASFPPDQQRIDAVYTYVHPPVVAWLFAPLTAFSEPVAYLVWTVVSLAALVFAWHVAAPYEGVAKATLLLLAIGLWPLVSAFYYGQPIALVLACVAVAWWLVTHDRPVAAGLALAAATALKPQVMWLLPVVLLASGRLRAIAAWAAGCAVMAFVFAIALGSHGIASWVHALQHGQADPAHTVNTLIHFFGLGPVTIGLWLVFGGTAFAIGYRRRRDVNAVFAIGLVGTALVTFHFHELDYSLLILAAWFFLRASPPMWERLWLLPGIACVELLGVGTAQGPAWDVPTHAAVIVWVAGWLAVLVAGGFFDRLTDASSPVAVAVVEHPAFATDVADPRVADHL
ncbi:MAG TPA: glycosyltransferase family 87 protein [Candidatus Dormibacteraeota bacterium]|nr:glycosyltransferase family 87 protein [Candidatus Dormibacteraeota bacterium]